MLAGQMETIPGQLIDLGVRRDTILIVKPCRPGELDSLPGRDYDRNIEILPSP